MSGVPLPGPPREQPSAVEQDGAEEASRALAPLDELESVPLGERPARFEAVLENLTTLLEDNE